jgi:hypothetical protein
MIHWPELLRHAEDWTNGFLTGTAATSLLAIAGTAIVLVVRAI